MPIVESSYRVPRLLKNPHFHTIFCATFRKRLKIPYIRERLELSDGDFVDLDWSITHPRKLVILTHGMEGSSKSKYILHSVAEANRRGFSALAWNLRGCSGQVNRLPKFYHSGKSEDLDAVVKHAIKRGFREIYLAGFSLGGNLTLVYLGREGKDVNRYIRAAVAVSAPVDLAASEVAIRAPKNRLYLKRFLLDFKKKFHHKRARRGIYIDITEFDREITTLAELDDKYTAPWNGFPSAKIYYERSSALPVLDKIRIPFLLLNPKDDTFLADECYPVELAAKSKYFYLEVPQSGGHCAMLSDHRFNRSYMEKRLMDFFRDLH